MCGIAGGFGRPDEGRIAAMLEATRHRGPDGHSIHCDPSGRCILGHNRLAILDLAGGRQPMANETGTVWVAFNGEIYNFRSLREELARKGHRLSTDGDTEVLVHLYEDLGPAMVERLDGMFALALWDGRNLFLARDPLGIKPLYYGHAADGTLYFASELKALRQVCDEAREFPPGTWYLSGRGFHRYFTLPGPGEPPEPGEQPVPSTADDAVRAVRAALERAVAKRLVADVPVGVFLSGGLDSSLIAAIARRLTTGPLHSFAVGAAESPDLVAARQVARAIGTVHHEYVFGADEVTRALPDVIRHLESFDPALVRSAVATYFVSRLSSGLVKVILTGEGADELFAGYEYLEGRPAGWVRRELFTLTDALHNTNLQRVDRMTMAWSLEGRVPFLDREMVGLALSLPVAWKLRRTVRKRRPVAKWILRLVAADLLPAEIAWRKKEKFSHGTGTSRLLAQIAGGAEEALYAGIFARHFPGRFALGTVGRTISVVPGEIARAGSS